MEALLVVGVLLLPAIIYFVRSPLRPSNGYVLMTLVGMWIALSVAIFLGDWFFPGRGGPWAAVIAWIAMCIYAWKNASEEQARWPRRKRQKRSTRL